MSIISGKINERIRGLKDSYEVNKNIVHNGVKGGLNESELALLVRDVIPHRYKVTKGIIENSKNEQSNETDIIIYDDEVLPPYIKHDLSFVPVEAVKYAFEVKSRLDSSELKTTISKFNNFKSIGGTSPTVLFSFASDINGSELLRYFKNKDDFFINPSITVFVVLNKCYYYKETREFYLKDFMSVSDFFKSFQRSSNIDVDEVFRMMDDYLSDENSLEKISRSDSFFMMHSLALAKNRAARVDEKKLCVNGVDYGDIKFKVHKWIGLESDNMSIGNDVELLFFSGLSNTLSKENFGKYLLSDKGFDVKTFSLCYEDMWGNLSCQDFDENGLSYNIDEIVFSYESSKDSHRILFKIKE